MAERATLAETFTARMVGLLNRRSLAEAEGLILARCRSIHTWFMRFPIDAVFVDRAWRVVTIHKALPPWRLTPYAWRACRVIELPAGRADHCGVIIGDQLLLESLEMY